MNPSVASMFTRLVVGAATLLGLLTLVHVAVSGQSSNSPSSSLARILMSPSPAPSWLRKLASDETLASMQRDEKLRRSYVEAVAMLAETSTKLAQRYDIDGLGKLGHDLNQHLRTVASTRTKRQGSLLDFLGPFGGGGGQGADTGGAAGGGGGGLGTTITDAASGLLGSVTGALGGVLTGGLSSSLTSSLTSSLASSLSNAGLFLGVGLGQGAAQGLQLATPEQTKAVGEQVASQNNMTASTLDSAVQNAALGATSTVLSALNLGSSSTLKSVMAQAAPGLMGLGTGLGGGAVMGLKLSTKNVAPNPNATDVSGILGNFGFGLSNSVASVLDVGKLLSSASSPLMTQKLVAQIPSAAAGLGAGLGNGASMGLGLALRNMAPTPNQTDVNGIANNFGFGLSNSLTANLNLSQLVQAGTSWVGGGNMTKILPVAAAGLGKGLGRGAAIGLGLQADTPVATQPMPDGGFDVGGVVQGFAQSLSTGFLADGSTAKFLSSLGSSLGSGSMPVNLEVSKVAMGFGLGLVVGAGDAVDAMGGIDSIVNGNSTVPAGSITDSPVTFNDSVNGASVGLAQGLSSQGLVTMRKLLANSTALDTLLGRTSPAPATPQPLVPRSSLGPVVALARREQDSAADAIGSLFEGISQVNFSMILSTETISKGLQRSTDALLSDGVGGLGLVLLGLIRSGTVDLAKLGGISKAVLRVTPAGTLHIENDNTLYDIDTRTVKDNYPQGRYLAAANAVSVNGNKLAAFVAFLTVHSE